MKFRNINAKMFWKCALLALAIALTGGCNQNDGSTKIAHKIIPLKFELVNGNLISSDFEVPLWSLEFFRAVRERIVRESHGNRTMVWIFLDLSPDLPLRYHLALGRSILELGASPVFRCKSNSSSGEVCIEMLWGAQDEFEPPFWTSDAFLKYIKAMTSVDSEMIVYSRGGVNDEMAEGTRRDIHYSRYSSDYTLLSVASQLSRWRDQGADSDGYKSLCVEVRVGKRAEEFTFCNISLKNLQKGDENDEKIG